MHKYTDNTHLHYPWDICFLSVCGYAIVHHLRRPLCLLLGVPAAPRLSSSSPSPSSHLIHRREAKLGRLDLLSVYVDGDRVLAKELASWNVHNIHRVLGEKVGESSGHCQCQTSSPGTNTAKSNGKLT